MNVITIRALRPLVAHVLPPALALAAAALVWEAWVQWRDISIIVVPPPSAVWERFADDPGFFWREGAWTLYEASLGLLLAAAFAIGLAVIMAHSTTAERALFPLAIVMKVTPIVAIAPVLVIAFGYGMAPKIATAALISFFPLLANAVSGFRDVDLGALDFLRSLRASRWQLFWKLRLPSALPYLFAALKVTFPLALIGAVVAEWFTGDKGLGFIVFVARGNLDTPTLFAAIGVLAVTGVGLNVLISLAERRLLFWHETFRSTR